MHTEGLNYLFISTVVEEAGMEFFVYEDIEDKLFPVLLHFLFQLAETTAEVHLQENEIENLRNMLNKKPLPNVIQVSWRIAFAGARELYQIFSCCDI